MSGGLICLTEPELYEVKVSLQSIRNKGVVNYLSNDSHHIMIPGDLKNRKISIRVNEPYDWTQGIVAGRIIDIFDDRMILSLSKSIRGQKFRSSKMIVQPRYEGENFETLIKNKQLTVGGTLIKENSNETDYILIGDLKI